MQTQQVDLYSDSESEVDRGEVCGNIVWKGNQYPIYDGENIIGREDDCDVRIEHDSVSLKHAVLDFEEGVARMRDLKSKNGTSVESEQGSGTYIKLGPTKRNVEVRSGCKLRFGLVDCKYIAISSAAPSNQGSSSAAASAAPGKSTLKYDCETQFLNVPIPEESDVETDEGKGAHDDNAAIAKQFSIGSTSSNSFRSKTSVLEAETQIDQGLTLNSAEKAPVPGAFINTPSSLIKTRYEDGIACMGSPISTHTTPGGVPSRTAASPGGSSTSTTPSRDLRVTPGVKGPKTPMTAVGGDDCSTDDDLDVEVEEDNLPITAVAPNPYVPTTLFAMGGGSGMGAGAAAGAKAGVDTGVDTDASDDEDDMSQDLMHAPADQSFDAADDQPVDREPPGAPPQQASPLARVRPQVPVVSAFTAADADVDTDVSDGEMSVDFKLAQEDSLSAKEVPDVETLAQEVAASPVASRSASRSVSRTFSRSATGSRDGPPVTSAPDSPFHNLASADHQHRGGAGGEVGHRTDVQLQEESEREVHSSVFFSAISAPEPVDDTADEPAQPSGPSGPSMPSIPENRTASPAISEQSEVETTAEVATEAVARSPGAAIKALLSSSGMPEGVKVFRSQGGGLVDSYRTGSPELSSATSSYPPDVPRHFDFGAVPVADAFDPQAMDVVQEDPALAPAAAAKLEDELPATSKKAVKGRASKKRVLDSDDEADKEVSAAVEVPTTAAKGKKARLSVAKEPAPVEEPSVVAPEPVEKPVPAGRRGKAKDAAPEPAHEPAPEPAPAPAPEVVEAVEKPASKRGKGKPTAQQVDEAAAPAALEAAPVEPVSAPIVKGGKKGKGKAAEAQEVEPVVEALPEPAPEVVVSAAPATAKKGRGKQAAAAVEAPPTEEPAPAAEAVVPAAETEEAVAAPPKGAKKPTKKAVLKAEPEAEPAPPAVAEPVPLKGPSSHSRGEEADLAIRIMFTKVDDAPYAKFLKTLPNVSVTSDATVATHCVTLPELKRTPKLMVAINCGVKYVVTEQWIKDSVKSKSLLPVTQPIEGAPSKKAKTSKAALADPRADPELFQQLGSSPYIVQDADKEKLWGFSMASTLALPRNEPGAVKLFDRLCFFCTKGVCGETAPPAEELRTIIESGGGIWLSSLDEWTAYSSEASMAGASSASKPAAAKSKGKSKASADQEDTDAAAGPHALVVLSHPTVVKKEVTKKVLDAVAKGAAPASGVYSMELVFLACLKQRVDFDDHRLK